LPIVALTGLKGGIGKSTITGNLAAEMVAMGRTVAVLDADPQETLVHWAALGDGILSGIVESVDGEHSGTFRAKVEAAGRRADRVIIDCPPGFESPALLSALLADLVLLPAGPSPFDMLAVREALELAREARAQRGGRKPLIRFIPSKIQITTTTGRELGGSLEELGEKTLPAITQRIVISDSAMSGLTIHEYAPRSEAAAEFRALALAVEELLK